MEFVLGLDQLGDWSIRQKSVYVIKEKRDPGGIKAHFENCIKLMKSLRKISNFKLARRNR